MPDDTSERRATGSQDGQSPDGSSCRTDRCRASSTDDERPRLTRGRKLLFTAGVLGVAVVACLLGAEYLTRALIPIEAYYELTGDPILFYRLAGGIDCLDAGRPRAQTEQHIRGKTVFALHPPRQTRRVAWVGDSACFGCGVGDAETAPHVLQALASDRGVKLESINFGVPGYNVRQVREVVRKRCPQFRDLTAVVYYHHINDIVNAPWAELAPFVPSGLYWQYERPGNPLVRWLKRSALVRRVGHSEWVGSLLRPAPSATAPTGDSGTANPPPSVSAFSAQCVSLYDDTNRYGRQFRDDLNAMADDARRQGADFIMVYFPIESLLGHPASERLVKTLSQWCRAAGIPFIDVSNDFLTAGRPVLYADRTHPGPAGQRIVAERVWRILADNVK